MILLPPISTRSDTLLPYTTLFLSVPADGARHLAALREQCGGAGRPPLGGAEPDLHRRPRAPAGGDVAAGPGQRLSARPVARRAGGRRRGSSRFRRGLLRHGRTAG